MAKSETIVRYTADEIDEMVRRGEDRTDWVRVDALTEEELEASIDYDEEGYPVRGVVYVGIPGATRQLVVRLDADVIDWFLARGGDFQARMNAVLRDYVEAQQEVEAATATAARR